MKTRLHFTDVGTGEPALIFFHYFGGSVKTWVEVISRLSPAFRCIAIDLPGFGDSQELPNDFSISESATEVAELLEPLILKKFVLIGHSMGGKIALAVAALQPGGLKQLILLAPSPPTPEPGNDEKRNELLNAYGDREALEKIAKSLVAKPLTNVQLTAIVDDNLRINRTAWKSWIDEGSQEDISSQMKNIEVPLMVISGDEDPNFSTLFLQKEFSRWFRYIKFIELKNAGHLLPLEVPVAVVDWIAKEVELK